MLKPHKKNQKTENLTTTEQESEEDIYRRPLCSQQQMLRSQHIPNSCRARLQQSDSSAPQQLHSRLWTFITAQWVRDDVVFSAASATNSSPFVSGLRQKSRRWIFGQMKWCDTCDISLIFLKDVFGSESWGVLQDDTSVPFFLKLAYAANRFRHFDSDNICPCVCVQGFMFLTSATAFRPSCGVITLDRTPFNHNKYCLFSFSLSCAYWQLKCHYWAAISTSRAPVSLFYRNISYFHYSQTSAVGLTQLKTV